MSIVIFSNTLQGFSGLQKSLIETANLMSGRGHDVHVMNMVGKGLGLSEAKPRLALSEAVKVYSIFCGAADNLEGYKEKFSLGYQISQEFLKQRYTNFDLENIRYVFSRIKENDAIIFTHPLQSVLYKVSGSYSKAPKILQVHGNFLDERHNLSLLNESVECIDYIQVVARGMIDDLVRETGVDKERFVYIPNVHIPKNIRTNIESKNVSIIGSLQDRKGQFDAVKAISLLNRSDIKLHIWGGAKGDYYNDLKLYIQKKGLEDKVIFKGVGNEEEIYKDTGVIIMTSRSEGFSYIHMESASHKIPSVVYDFQYGPKDFFISGENGYIVDYGDYRALARHIEELVNDPEKKKLFGERCYQRFVSEFSVEQIYQSYARCLSLEAQSIRTDGQLLIPVKRDTQLGRPHIKDFVCKEKITITLKGIKKVFENTFKVEIKGCPDSDAKLVLMFKDGQREIPCDIRDSEVVIKAVRIPRTRSGYPKKHVAYLQIAEEYLYLYNTTLRGDLEFLSEFETNYPRLTGRKSISEIPHFVSQAGLNLIYPGLEVLKSVTNETGRTISYRPGRGGAKGRNAPYLIGVRGEYQEISVVTNSGSKLDVTFPRRSFNEIYEKINNIEKKHRLCEFTVRGDIYPWELIRATVIDLLMEFHGNWGGLVALPSDVDPEFHGSKKLRDIQDTERLVFEFVRKREQGVSKFVAEFYGDKQNSTLIEYPQKYGYSIFCYDRTENIYPIKEYFDERSEVIIGDYGWYDSDFLEDIFFEEFGAYFNFKTIVNERIEKYLKEYNWWNEFFSNRDVKELIIPSAYWFPGIVQAARDNDVRTSDVQYSAIFSKHPNYGFTNRKRYTADNIYIWSDYWNLATLPHREKTILASNWMKEIISESKTQPRQGALYDFVIVSQTRLRDSFMDFTIELSREHPNSKIVYSAHPDDSDEHVSALADCPNVVFSTKDTLSLVRDSEIAIGAYSTSLFEAAALGCSVYILNIPGSELVEREIDNGLFRRFTGFDRLEKFSVDKKLVAGLFA